MIEQHACITIICDADKRVFDGGGEMRLHFDSIDEGRSDAEEYGWFVADDGRALCGSGGIEHATKACEFVDAGLTVDELERLIGVYPQVDPEEEDEDGTGGQVALAGMEVSA